MRKILFLTVVLLSALAVSAKNPSPHSGLYSTTSKWSVDIAGGLNLFDGDVSQPSSTILPASNLGTAFGVSVNYRINPVYGFYVDYNRVTALAQMKTWDIKTRINNVAANASINFLNLLFPSGYKDQNPVINLYGSIGWGLSRYYYHVTPADNSLASYGVAAIVPISLYGTYDLSDHVALGFKMSFVAFTTDNLEGVNYLNYKGVCNDRIETGTFFLRYNF